MKTQHTPGPWHADANGSIWRRNPSDLYENGGGVAGDRQIATAWKGWVNDGEIGYPLEANARLIAAAPDLLEFAQWILTFKMGGLIDARAIDVINKATGKA